jgi:hypothetical protein
MVSLFSSPVLVDSYEALDQVVNVFDTDPTDDAAKRVIVDLAAQTATPLASWIKDSDLLSVLAELGVSVNFWHVADAGRDSVELLDKLLDTYGAGPNYVIVRNLGRGSDFSQLDGSAAMARALTMGARVIHLAQVHEASMRKIDRQNVSFWAAVNHRSGDDSLGLLERQRVRSWLKKSYEAFEALPL